MDGPLANQKQALYLTATGLGLFMGAVALLYIAFSQGRPQTASGPAGLPATGGSSA